MRQMLRRPPAPEPAIIGRVENELRPVCAIDNLTREHNLVAYLDACTAKTPQLQRRRASARLVVNRAGNKSGKPDRFKDGTHRQIFAIGHKMRLGIIRKNVTATINCAHRIASADRAQPPIGLPHGQMNETREKNRLLTDDCGNPLARKLRITTGCTRAIVSIRIAIFEIVRNRSFRPKYQAGFIAARQCILSQPCKLFLVFGRVVTLLLRDQRLDQHEWNRAFIVDVSRGREKHCCRYAKRDDEREHAYATHAPKSDRQPCYQNDGAGERVGAQPR